MWIIDRQRHVRRTDRWRESVMMRTSMAAKQPPCCTIPFAVVHKSSGARTCTHTHGVSWGRSPARRRVDRRVFWDPNVYTDDYIDCRCGPNKQKTAPSLEDRDTRWPDVRLMLLFITSSALSFRMLRSIFRIILIVVICWFFLMIFLAQINIKKMQRNLCLKRCQSNNIILYYLS